MIYVASYVDTILHSGNVQCTLNQGQRKVFITGQAKLNPEYHLIECVGGQ